MFVHTSQDGVDKNRHKQGVHVVADGEAADTQQTASDQNGSPSATQPEDSERDGPHGGARQWGGAKGALAQAGKWLQQQSEAHPYWVVVVATAAGAATGAIVRKRSAMRMALTAGILTAMYLRRKRGAAKSVAANTAGVTPDVISSAVPQGCSSP